MGKHTFLVIVFSFGLSAQAMAAPAVTPLKPAADAFSLTSPAFAQGEQIPELYTCKGGDFNPPLDIHNVPPGTRSLVLVVRNPDNPITPWSHWLVYNIRPTTRQIKENSDPGTQALNDFGNFYYGGPCVFDAKEHHYIFTLYALNKYLEDVNEGATFDMIEKAMKGKIIAATQLDGTYQNPLWGKDDPPL
jgi:Raf kinase inhibitor-like YbhB/YbcL family protein